MLNIFLFIIFTIFTGCDFFNLGPKKAHCDITCAGEPSSDICFLKLCNGGLDKECEGWDEMCEKLRERMPKPT